MDFILSALMLLGPRVVMGCAWLVGKWYACVDAAGQTLQDTTDAVLALLP